MKFISCFLFTLSFFISAAQRTDRKLEHEINKLIEGFNGEVGIYVKNLRNSKTVSIHADTIFPTASMVKIPILIGIMYKINNGELDYHQQLTYRDSLLYPGVDILGSFKDTERIELGKLMMLMLTMSDNTASLWLQSLAGGGIRINQLLDSLGLQSTRVNSRTPGRELNRSEYGWGQTTPKEMATLMEKIASGNIISKERSAEMMRLLGRNFWDENAISQIPSDVFVASKNGAVNESRSEVLFVNGRKKKYIFCICTKNIKDQSWLSSNEAWTMTRKISKLLWERL
ncbi:MAG: serine hydrolase [Flavisolibacter sp.]